MPYVCIILNTSFGCDWSGQIFGFKLIVFETIYCNHLDISYSKYTLQQNYVYYFNCFYCKDQTWHLGRQNRGCFLHQVTTFALFTFFQYWEWFRNSLLSKIDKLDMRWSELTKYSLRFEIIGLINFIRSDRKIAFDLPCNVKEDFQRTLTTWTCTLMMYEV